MADPGRDLKVSVISDADRFDLAQPADQVEQLGDAADTAGRDLDKLDRSLEDTAQAGDDLARDVDQAAGRIDTAFDKIAAASRRSAGKVDDDSDRAGASLRDMGEEGQDTAREMAASFDGTADGIQDAFQEAATNVLAQLGPLGAVAGVAGGVALGMWRAGAEKLRETVQGLTADLLETGGRATDQSVLGQLRTMAEDGTITDFAGQARRAGVDVKDYLRALAGDPEALERTREALSGIAQVTNQRYLADQVDAANDMRDALDGTAEAYSLANDAAQAYAAAAGDSAEAIQAYSDAAAEFVDVADVYSTVLAEKETKERETATATAAATKSQTDSWEDYAKDVSVSVDEYLAELQRQVDAQASWATNLEKLAARGVSAGVLAELARMGPEGAPLIAAFVAASDSELAKLDGLMQLRASTSVDAFTGALDAGQDQAAGAGRRLGGAVVDELGAGVRAGREGVTKSLDATTSGAAAAVSGRHTVSVPIRGDDSKLIADAQRAVFAAVQAIQSIKVRP